MKKKTVQKLARVGPSYPQWEMQFLAPYAVKSVDSRGRDYAEKEQALRTPFQRDRDRIIHSTAFRRLQYKTQVFVNHEGDHYRTRLTHTLETCQIARTLSRALALNEDLTEAIALAHDLGHGPFGHAGEWALQGLMKAHGGFEHNVQCLRIVEKLEESYPEFPGLNLTFETREGLKKHPEHFYPDRSRRFRSLEAEVVDQADGIAYNTHDLDDGLRSELITAEQLEGLSLWRDALRYIRKKYSRLPAFQEKRLAIRLIINELVMDLLAATRLQIQKSGIQSLSDIQKFHGPIVLFSAACHRRLAELRKFLHQNLYQHHRVVRMTDKGQRFLRAIFQVYLHKPAQLPREVLRRNEKEGTHRVICDYMAGMTDRFALDEYNRLFQPYERV